MKNKIIILLISLLGMTSCEGVLDIQPDGRKSLADMFTTDLTTAAYLNSCYVKFPQFGITNYFWTNYRIALSDDANEPYVQVLPVYKGSLTSQNSVVENELGQANDNQGGFWNNYWQSIRRCNVFLQNIPTATVNLQSDRNR